MRLRARRPKLDVRSTVKGAPVAPLRRAAEAFTVRRLPGREVVIELRIVGQRRMRTLNRAWRGVDHATDVLSMEAPVPPAGPVLVGPIVLCPEVATRAEQPRERSLPYLLVHGLLHGIGWDHQDDAADARMDTEVRAILRGAAIRV